MIWQSQHRDLRTGHYSPSLFCSVLQLKLYSYLTANLGNMEFNCFSLTKKPGNFYHVLRLTTTSVRFYHSLSFYNQKDKNFVLKHESDSVEICLQLNSPAFPISISLDSFNMKVFPSLHTQCHPIFISLGADTAFLTVC